MSVLVEEGVSDGAVVGVSEEGVVSLGVGVSGGGKVEGVGDGVENSVGDGEADTLGVGVNGEGVDEEGAGVSLAIGEGVRSSVLDALGVGERVEACVGVEGVSVEEGTVPEGSVRRGVSSLRPRKEKADRKKISPACNKMRAGRLG